MSEYEITVVGGTSVRLPTAGKYCDRDILITAIGGITPDDIASAGITGDIELSASSIVAHSFAENKGITSLSAPNVTSVGAYGFYNSTGMKSVYLPACTSINNYCFTNMVTTILSLPECTSVGTYSFTGCKQITQLDLPQCKTIGTGSFNNCTKIAKLYLPKCQTIGNSCLASILITELILPECTSIGNSSLSGLKNCTYVDLPKCKSLANYALRNSANLATLILRSETMCTLSNYALNSTQIWNGTGHVYVPRALMANYQAATNWKTIHGKNNATFRALEDYTVDGTITGELDENKI